MVNSTPRPGAPRIVLKKPSAISSSGQSRVPSAPMSRDPSKSNPFSSGGSSQPISQNAPMTRDPSRQQVSLIKGGGSGQSRQQSFGVQEAASGGALATASAIAGKAIEAGQSVGSSVVRGVKDTGKGVIESGQFVLDQGSQIARNPNVLPGKLGRGGESILATGKSAIEKYREASQNPTALTERAKSVARQVAQDPAYYASRGASEAALLLVGGSSLKAAQAARAARLARVAVEAKNLASIASKAEKGVTGIRVAEAAAEAARLGVRTTKVASEANKIVSGASKVNKAVEGARAAQAAAVRARMVNPFSTVTRKLAAGAAKKASVAQAAVSAQRLNVARASVGARNVAANTVNQARQALRSPAGQFVKAVAVSQVAAPVAIEGAKLTIRQDTRDFLNTDNGKLAVTKALEKIIDKRGGVRGFVAKFAPGGRLVPGLYEEFKMEIFNQLYNDKMTSRWTREEAMRIADESARVYILGGGVGEFTGALASGVAGEVTGRTIAGRSVSNALKNFKNLPKVAGQSIIPGVSAQSLKQGIAAGRAAIPGLVVAGAVEGGTGTTSYLQARAKNPLLNPLDYAFGAAAGSVSATGLGVGTVAGNVVKPAREGKLLRYLGYGIDITEKPGDIIVDREMKNYFKNLKSRGKEVRVVTVPINPFTSTYGNTNEVLFVEVPAGTPANSMINVPGYSSPFPGQSVPEPGNDGGRTPGPNVPSDEGGGKKGDGDGKPGEDTPQETPQEQETQENVPANVNNYLNVPIAVPFNRNAPILFPPILGGGQGGGAGGRGRGRITYSDELGALRAIFGPKRRR